MADLSRTSSINVLIDGFLVSLVAYSAYCIHVSSPQIPLDSPFHPQTFFIGIGVVSFAFQCQHSAFIIANSLENSTSNRWAKVSSLGLTIACILALIMGVSGYLAFREDTMGNILNNLSTYTDLPIWVQNIARISMSTTMFFVYPIKCFVARHVVYVLPLALTTLL